MVYIIIAILIVSAILYILQSGQKRLNDADRACDATYEWCESSEALISWVSDHRGWSFTHPADLFEDQEFQELLKKEIGAYRNFLHTHPYYQDNGHLERFLHLVIDKSFIQ